MYHLTIMTAATAEAHDRRVHNVPPTTRIGWRIYRYRVRTHDVLPVTAFVDGRDFRRWLRANCYKLHGLRQRLEPGFGAIATAQIVPDEDARKLREFSIHFYRWHA